VSAASIVGLCALVAAAAEPASAEIVLDERAPLDMLVTSPFGNDARAATWPPEAVYRAADEALRARTSLRVRSAEQGGLDVGQISACELKERLACWTRAVGASGASGNFLVVSLTPIDAARSRLVAIMLDVSEAQAILRATDRTRVDVEVEVENRIYEEAVRSVSGVIRTDEHDALLHWFEAAFDRELGPSLAATGRGEPCGAIALSADAEGLTIALDGATVGTTRNGVSMIRDVRAKARRVVISDPLRRFATRDLVVAVSPGETAAVRAELVPLPSPESSAGLAKKALFWGGVGLAAVGTGIAAYALVKGPAAKEIMPCTPGSACDSGTHFATACELVSDRPGGCSNRGVLVAPLGYAIALAGAVFAGGALASEEDPDFPWWPVPAGLAAGVAAYLLSAALR
jgi:hypothetical protein